MHLGMGLRLGAQQRVAAAEPDPGPDYSGYYGPSGEVPTLIMDFHNEVYAEDTGSGLTAIPDIADYFTTFSALEVGGDSIQRLRTGNADSCALTPGAWFSATAGTVKCRYLSSGVASGDVVWSFLTDGNNRIRLQAAAGPTTRFHIRNGGADQANVQLAATFEDAATISVCAWASGSANGSRNGAAVGTLDTSVNLPAVTTLNLGHELAGGRLGGGIREFVYWDTRIADASLPTMSAA